MISTTAIIVAAGQGLRAGGDVPKQYQSIGGRPVLAWVLDRFLAHPRIGRVLVTIGAQDHALFAALSIHHAKLLPPTIGGASRQESVRLALESLANENPSLVLIHDGVRPFVSPPLIDRVIDALGRFDGALPALAVTDTLQQVSREGIATGTIPREGLFAGETPQGFHYRQILAAHEKAAKEGEAFTDDATLARWAGQAVHVVAGERENIKLTTAKDIEEADRRIRPLAQLPDIRVGTGYDVHVLGPGKGVMLGGIFIPHDQSLIGHSDADVALHALTDAILGALAEGDIGSHFPPSSEEWRGASSDRFLAFAAKRVGERGGMIAHLDLAVIAEAPRLAPHRDAMRNRIAAIAGISPERVAVKATTNEGVGFVGRGEGIAALATATVRLPESAS